MDRFPGHPAAFSDGAFRLAALLRRPVVFMAGLYLGRRRYQLRFAPLADFSETTGTVPEAGRAARDATVQAAVVRYARLLEHAVPRHAVQLVQFLRLLGRQPRPAGRFPCEPRLSLTRWPPAHGAVRASGWPRSVARTRRASTCRR
jgi:lauroyl/myristoyl acyltransferase